MHPSTEQFVNAHRACNARKWSGMAADAFRDADMGLAVTDLKFASGDLARHEGRHDPRINHTLRSL